MEVLYGLTVCCVRQVGTCSVSIPVAAALFVVWDSLHELILNEVCSLLFKCTLIYHHLYGKQVHSPGAVDGRV